MNNSIQTNTLWNEDIPLQFQLEYRSKVVWLLSVKETPHFIYIHPNFINVWGMDLEPLYSDYFNLFNTIHPEDRDKYCKNHELLISQKQSFDIEFRIIRKDGEERWLRSSQYFIDTNGTDPVIFCYAEDITSWKKLEYRHQLQFKFARLNDDISHAALTAVDENEFFHEITQLLKRTFFSNQCGILLFNTQSECVEVHTSFIFDESREQAETSNLILSIASRVAESRSLIRIIKSEETYELSESLTENNHAKCVPLSFKDHFLGVIYIEYPYHLLSPGDGEEIITSLATRISEAIYKIRLNQDLTTSIDRHRMISQSMSDYAYSLTIDDMGNSRLDWVSDAFIQKFKFTIEDINRNGSWLSIVHPEDLSAAREHGERILNGNSDSCDLRFITRDGEIRNVRNYAFPIYDDKHKRVSLVYGAAKDVTEEKRSEEIQSVLFAIANETNQVDSLDALLPVIHNQLGRLIDTRNFYIALYHSDSNTYSFPYYIDQYDPDMPGMHEKYELPGSLTDYVRRLSRPVLLTDEDFQELVEKGEVILVGPSSPIWMGAPLVSPHGVIGVVAVQSYEDPEIYNENDLAILEFVSDHVALAIDRKKTQDELRNSEELFRNMVENVQDIFYIIDVNGKIKYASPSLTKRSGYLLEEIINKFFINFVFKEDRKEIISIYRHLATSDQNETRCEFRAKLKNGHPIWVEQTTHVARDELGNVIEFWNVMRDIGERKRSEQAIRKQAYEFETLYRISQEISTQHNLNSLLKTITSYASKLLDADGASIGLFDVKTEEVELAFAINFPIEIGTRVKLGQGMSGQVAKSRKPLIVDDYNLWEQRIPEREGLISASNLMVPMLHSGELIGVLGVYRKIDHPQKFVQDNIRLLSLLAAQAASAIHSSKLLTQTEQRAEKLAALSEAGLAFTHTLELVPLLKNILKAARKAIPSAEKGTVMLLEEGGQFTIRAAVGYQDSFVSNTTIPLDKGYASKCLVTKQSLLIQDVQENHEYFYPGTRNELRVRSAIVVPLIADGVAIGTMSLDNSSHTHAFNDDDLGLLYAFANQASGVIKNSRLFEETRKRLNDLEIINKISSALREKESLSELLEVFIDKILEIVNTDTGTILLFDPIDEKLFYVTDRGWFADLNEFDISSGEGIAGHVYTNGVSYISREFASDDLAHQDFKHRMPKGWGGACIPIKSTRETIGVFFVSLMQPREITKEQIRILEIASDIAGNAIHRSKLHEKTQQRAAHLSAINRIGRSLSESIDLENIYDSVHKLTSELFNEVSKVIIANYDHRSNNLTPAYLCDAGNRLESSTLHSINVGNSNDSLINRVFSTRQPTVIRNYSAGPTHKDEVSENCTWCSTTTRSAILAPLLTRERVSGVILLLSNNSNVFDANDAEMLGVVANTAASAIDNARLFSETLRQLDQLQALRTVDQAISASVNMRSTLDVLLDQAINRLGGNAARIFLLNSVTQYLESAISRGFYTRTADTKRERLGEGRAGKCAYTRKTTIITSPIELVTKNLKMTSNAEHGFQFCAVTPLVAKGQVIGVLEVFKRDLFSPDTDWINFFEMLAGQAAIAIDNAQMFENLQRTNLELSISYDNTIEGWARALELRDQETEGHTRRVVELTERLSTALNINGDKLIHMRRGAMLHDIGKMAIPDAILHKPGPLTDDEWVIMRKHTIYAKEMLSTIPYLTPSLDIPYYHHEKWDGSGYPQGLEGEAIPLPARIFALIDVYDALTSDRPYRQAWTKERAKNYVREQSGRHFDPALVPIFIRVLEKFQG